MRSRTPMFIDDRHDTRRSLTRRVGLVLGVVVLLGAVVTVLLWWYAGSRLEPTTVATLEASEGGPGATNLLVVGTDGPPGRDATVGGVAAESILLVQLSDQRARPVVVTLPVALRVAPTEGGAQRLGDVFTESGADALVEAVRNFTGVGIDHYVGVDLDGAARIAAATEGVEVCPEEPVRDEAAGLDLEAGCQELGGDDAVAWVRSGDDAFVQVRRSLQFVGSAAAEAGATSRKLNPLATRRLVDAVAATTVTDRDLGLTSLYGMADALAGTDADDVDLRTVPATVQSIDGEQYVVAAPERAPGLFDALADGRDLDADVGTEVADELGAEDVEVLVVNGVGINGLAGRVQSYLEERGFPVVDAVNPQDLDPDAEFDTTLQELTIRHTEATLPHAQLLRDHLGDLPIALEQVEEGELPEDAAVLLEVGAAWPDR